MLDDLSVSLIPFTHEKGASEVLFINDRSRKKGSSTFLTDKLQAKAEKACSCHYPSAICFVDSQSDRSTESLGIELKSPVHT